jgi:hypothetical protein
MRVRILIPLQALAGLLAFALLGTAQSSYNVISVVNSGTITGTVKWAGVRPKPLSAPITKDQLVCDPNSAKSRDLERLEVSVKMEVLPILFTWQRHSREGNGSAPGAVFFAERVKAGAALKSQIEAESKQQLSAERRPSAPLLQGRQHQILQSMQVLRAIRNRLDTSSCPECFFE